MDEDEVYWEYFWSRFEERKKELVFKEGFSWDDADVIARDEFGLDD